VNFLVQLVINNQMACRPCPLSAVPAATSRSQELRETGSHPSAAELLRQAPDGTRVKIQLVPKADLDVDSPKFTADRSKLLKCVRVV